MNLEPETLLIPRILLVLRDVEMGSRLATGLRCERYDVVTCSRMGEVPGMVATIDDRRSWDLAIWDVEMLDEPTLQSIEDWQNASEFPPLIVITAFSDQQTLGRVRSLKSEAVFDSHLDTSHQVAAILQFFSR